MKELPIEEKARRYDEAYKKEAVRFGSDVADEIFQLSEDERIRTAIIHFISHTPTVPKGVIDKETMLAWLEKQGEYNHTDKTEPKFKNEQWIVWQDKCYKVNDNGCGYELVDKNGLSTSLEYGTIDENAHLWDITKDAKDGDVLVCKDYGYNSYILFGEKNIHCWYNGQTEHFHPTTSCKLRKDATIYPATKEQRYLLFQKMHEAGYMYDSESKQLLSLKAEVVDEQNPVWSKEDALRLEEVICMIEANGRWVRSDDAVKLVLEWLKSLKDRVLPKQEWSEEDKYNLSDIEAMIHTMKGDGLNADRLINWLKSLKPQNRWKPSDGQMKALKEACDEHWEPDGLDPLYTLYQDLKKLKE